MPGSAEPVALAFSYREAFRRNLGWLTEAEQERLRGKRIAIAGLGGVGGAHLLTLTRLGIGAFNLADFDRFELHNFNRQVGANVDSIGRPKVEVMADMARAINPELDLRLFPDGVSADNAAQFLDGVDLYVDGLDFFVLDERQRVFALCEERGIPAITAAPLGMGAALLVFLPGQMSFEEYFRMGDLGGREGGPLPRRPVAVDAADGLPGRSVARRPRARTGPSTPMACDLCAGIAATEALKVLLGRGGVVAAPRGVHFDAYKNRLRRTWRPGGNAASAAARADRRDAAALCLGPRRGRAARRDDATAVASPRVAALRRRGQPRNRPRQILDLARWAPSGDNTPAVAFRGSLRRPRRRARVRHPRATASTTSTGQASQLSVGALLETLRIAASAHGRLTRVTRRRRAPTNSRFSTFAWSRPAAALPDPLHAAMRERAVQRKPLSTRRDRRRATRRALDAALGPDHRVLWFEAARQRARWAWLAVRSAKIRLTIPEAYAVHRDVIAWGARFSDDRIPDQALGAGALSLRSMRWALGSWRRVQTMNRYFGGTLAPRLELDLLPGLRCGAHFAIVAARPPRGIDDHVAAGAAVQRFWLTATGSACSCSRSTRPWCSARTPVEAPRSRAIGRRRAGPHEVRTRLDALLGASAAEGAVFLGRIGHGPAPTSRSLRLPLEKLHWSPGFAHDGRRPSVEQAS